MTSYKSFQLPIYNSDDDEFNYIDSGYPIYRSNYDMFKNFIYNKFYIILIILILQSIYIIYTLIK